MIPTFQRGQDNGKASVFFCIMKHFIQKLFYWDAPGQGALFALTFFFVCSALWFTLYQSLWLSNCGIVQLNIMSERLGREILAWAVVQMLIAAYSLAVFSRAIWLLCKNCHLLHNYRPLLCVFPSIALYVCSGLFCLVPLFSLLKVVSPYGGIFSSTPRWVSLFSSLPPQYWGIAYLAAVLLMTLGGFSIVVSVARGTGVALRQTVCKPGIALWGVFWTAYFLFLVLALVQSAALSKVRSLIEKRFGYSLTAEGLREYYQKMGPADAEWWERFKKKAKLPSKLPVGDSVLEYWDGRAPDQLTPQFLSAFDNYCKSNEASLQEAEKCFDSIPPLPQYNFVPGKLIAMFSGHLISCRQFTRLELSRMRVFLMKQDKANALRAYQRISNCTKHLQREPFVIGSLVWIAIERVRLEAMERLLESRLLTEDDLRVLAADLTMLEERIPVIQQQAMYTEATFGQDAFLGMETGNAPDATIAFAQLRWFYPQLWLQAARDKMYILQQYVQEDFTHWQDTPPPSAYIFSCMLNPVLKATGNKFNALASRARAMQALLRAEAYRREHGDYPETLPDLPIDPFTGKPMLYRYGTAEITEYVLQLTEEATMEEDGKKYELNPQPRQTRCVQVWSVGPNGKDEEGRGSSDDCCARIRLE